jgi:hypothetical protein
MSNNGVMSRNVRRYSRPCSNSTVQTEALRQAGVCVDSDGRDREAEWGGPEQCSRADSRVGRPERGHRAIGRCS